MDETYASPTVFMKISNAVLENFGIISEENRNDLLKITQVASLAKKRRLGKTSNVNCIKIMGIAFDGRKDNMLPKEGGRLTKVKQEHYTILALPQEKYIGHTNPKSGGAEDIA